MTNSTQGRRVGDSSGATSTGDERWPNSLRYLPTTIGPASARVLQAGGLGVFRLVGSKAVPLPDGFTRALAHALGPDWMKPFAQSDSKPGTGCRFLGDLVGDRDVLIRAVPVGSTRGGIIVYFLSFGGLGTDSLVNISHGIRRASSVVVEAAQQLESTYTADPLLAAESAPGKSTRLFTGWFDPAAHVLLVGSSAFAFPEADTNSPINVVLFYGPHDEKARRADELAIALRRQGVVSSVEVTTLPRALRRDDLLLRFQLGCAVTIPNVIPPSRVGIATALFGPAHVLPTLHGRHVEVSIAELLGGKVPGGPIIQ